MFQSQILQNVTAAFCTSEVLALILQLILTHLFHARLGGTVVSMLACHAENLGSRPDGVNDFVDFPIGISVVDIWEVKWKIYWMMGFASVSFLILMVWSHRINAKPNSCSVWITRPQDNLICVMIHHSSYGLVVYHYANNSWDLVIHTPHSLGFTIT